MGIYQLLPQPQAYGYDIGILLLDQVETHVPGDTAHAATYDYPVLFLPVRGATAERVIRGDPALTPAIVQAARELERMGVRGIASNCGFMLQYQDAVAGALGVPVMLSSLLQIDGIVHAMGDKPFGIATASLANFRRLQESFPALKKGRAHPVGLDGTPILDLLFTADFDSEQLQDWLLSSARRLMEERGIRALLLECAVFTPYARTLQATLGIPVFDFVSMIDHLHSAVRARPSRPLP